LSKGHCRQNKWHEPMSITTKCSSYHSVQISWRSIGIFQDRKGKQCQNFPLKFSSPSYLSPRNCVPGSPLPIRKAVKGSFSSYQLCNGGRPWRKMW
jgi:hypothetical protein